MTGRARPLPARTQDRRDRRQRAPDRAFLANAHSLLTLLLGITGTLGADTMQGDRENMNLRPASPRLRRLLPLAAAAAIGIGIGAGVYALTSNGSGTSSTSKVVVPAQPASSTSTVDSLTQLYKDDAPGVVDITVESTSGSNTPSFPFSNPQQGQQKTEAEGTGFVIDTKGNILTAQHVVNNDQIESDTNDNSGVGFAVPINAAKSVAQTLIAGGTVHHAYVGVRIKDAANGAQITQIVANSPASKAGLKVGDVVTAFDGNSITSADALTAAVLNAKS